MIDRKSRAYWNPSNDNAIYMLEEYLEKNYTQFDNDFKSGIFEALEVLKGNIK